MSFHVVLPSNSSFELYPDNTLADFRVRLAKPIKLSEPYEVALEEIAYPRLSHDFESGETDITVSEFQWIGEEGTPEHKVEEIFNDRVVIHCSTKNGTRTLLWYINNGLMQHGWKLIMSAKDKFTLVRKEGTKRVLQLDAKLAFALGFAKEPFAYNVVATQEGPYASPMLFQSKQMFVYVNVIAPQLVGDSQVPLLRICIPQNSTNFSDYTSEKYIRPYYLPVCKEKIDEIHIQIRTHTGEIFPFPSGAPLICKLHFRPSQ
jgi:hypothetical protein